MLPYPAKASAMVLFVFLTALDVWGESRPAAISYSSIRGSSYWGRPVRGRDMCLDRRTSISHRPHASHLHAFQMQQCSSTPVSLHCAIHGRTSLRHS